MEKTPAVASSSALGLPWNKVHSAAFKEAKLAFLLPTLLEAVDACGTDPGLSHGDASTVANRKGWQYPATTRVHMTKELEEVHQLNHCKAEVLYKGTTPLKFFGGVLICFITSVREINQVFHIC